MNVLLAINGLLLLALIGSQQWFAYDWHQHGMAPLSLVQSVVFDIQSFLILHICPLACSLWFYFLIASFVVPLIASLKAKSLKLTHRDLLGIYMVNPILFLVVGTTYVPTFEPYPGLLVPQTVSLNVENRPRLSLFPSTVGFIVAASNDVKRIYFR